MKPLNRSERNHTFLRFLLLFLVTVALIVTVVLLSVEVPVKESEQLRSQMFDTKKEKDLSDSLSVVMRQAVDELKKFDPEKGDASATSYQVQMRIDRMYEILKRIPNGENSIYDLMIQNISDLNKAKKIINSRK
jgi:predicted lactoylglutathione lyase